MIVTRHLLRVMLLSALLASGAPPPAAAQARPAAGATGDVTVTAAVDRPAMWVGDRLTYTIAITCRHGVDIVVDDLAREKLTLGGLEAIGSDLTRQADGDVTQYEFHYQLTTYRVDLPTLTIAPLAVRYFVARPGQRPEDTPPAGTLQVPGTSVALRSLLPDDQPYYEPRDGRPVPARWLPYRALGLVGAGLILLSAAPVIFLVIGLVRAARRRRAAAPRSSRHARQASRAALEEIRAAEPVTLDARRDAFAHLAALVRRHLHEVTGVEAAGLTPPEMAAALDAAGSRVPSTLVSSLLTACELARYADPERVPSIERWRDAVAEAEQVIATGR
jgi:hypothetical protein